MFKQFKFLGICAAILTTAIADIQCAIGSDSLNEDDVKHLWDLWQEHTPDLTLPESGVIPDYGFDDPGYILINKGVYFQVLNHQHKSNTINEDYVRQTIYVHQTHGAKCDDDSEQGYGLNYYVGGTTGLEDQCDDVDVGSNCKGSYSNSKLIWREE